MTEFRADVNKKTIKNGAPSRRKKQRRQPFRLTARDERIVRWLADAGIATRQQIQALFFGRGGRTRCQERLNTLVRNRYIDRMPRARMSDPTVYWVGRRSTNGRRLLRAGGSDGTVRKVHPARMAHTLDVISCRIQVTRACVEWGYALLRWVDEDELIGLTGSSGLVPDALFQMARPAEGGEKRSAFFLEVERSGKSDRTLREKLRRYGEYYYSGRFEQTFGTKALRILVLFGSEFGMAPEREVARVLSVAEELGVTLVCLASLDEFLALEPSRVFDAAIWARPGRDSRVSLVGY